MPPNSPEAAAAAAEIAPAVPPEEASASPDPEEMLEEEPPKPEVSDAMKARLRRELESQGANPNKSAGNPILVVAAVIGVLVIIGGQGKTYCSGPSVRANPI